MTTTTTHPPFLDNVRALGRAQKPALNSSAYARLVNRPLGRLVAAALHVPGVSPNQATAFSACLTFSGLLILVLVAPRPWSGALVAFLLALGYVVDSSDGQLARLRGGGSRAGEWLDHTVDCFKMGSLHLAVLISWYRFTAPADGWLLVPLAFQVVAVVIYFGLMLMPTLRGPAQAPTGAAPATVAEKPLRKFLLLPSEYGVLCWAFLLLGWPATFRWLYLALLACNAGAMAFALRKWWRELRRIDAETVPQEGG